MKDFQNMKQSLTPDDPLSKGIILFKKKREQADMIEHIFRNIKQTYKASDIDSMKNHLDSKLSQKNPAYNIPAATSYFSQLKSKISTEAFGLRELAEHQLVADYKQQEHPQSWPKPLNTTTNTVPHLPIAQTHQVVSRPTVQSVQPVSTARSNTPSRIDRVASITPASVQAQPKQVSFGGAQVLGGGSTNTGERAPVSPQTSPHLNQHSVQGKPYPPSDSNRPVVVSQAQGSITAGNPPLAQVSADKTEVTLNYSLTSPKVSLIKNVLLEQTGGVPNTILALDDKNVVVGCSDGKLQVVDLQANKVAKELRLSAPVRCLERFGEDGRNRVPFGVLVGLGAPENAIALVDLAGAAGQCLATFRSQGGEVTSLAALGAGEFLSGTSDGLLSLWSVGSTGAPRSSIKAHNHSLNAIAVLSSGRTVATGGDDSMVRLFGLDRGQFVPKGELLQNSQVVMVDAFHGNSRFLLVGLSNGLLKICNADSGECLKELPGHRGSPLGALKVLGAADVYLLTFARGEDAPGLTTVDENTVSRYPLSRPLILDYTKTGQRIVQITNGNQDSGFGFVLLEQDRSSSQVLLSCWGLS